MAAAATRWSLGLSDSVADQLRLQGLPAKESESCSNLSPLPGCHVRDFRVTEYGGHLPVGRAKASDRPPSRSAGQQSLAGWQKIWKGLGTSHCLPDWKLAAVNLMLHSDSESVTLWPFKLGTGSIAAAESSLPGCNRDGHHYSGWRASVPLPVTVSPSQAYWADERSLTATSSCSRKLQALIEVGQWYCGSIAVRSSLPTACREGAGSVAIIGLRRCQQPAQRLVRSTHACVWL